MKDTYKFELHRINSYIYKKHLYFSVVVINYCVINNLNYSFSTIVDSQYYNNLTSLFVDLFLVNEKDEDSFTKVFGLPANLEFASYTKKNSDSKIKCAAEYLRLKINNSQFDSRIIPKQFLDFSEAFTEWYKSTLEPIFQQQKQLKELYLQDQGDK